MTSFLATRSYSPALTLLLGCLTLIGLLGSGICVLRLVRLRLPSPWQEVTGLLLGIEVLSLAVQVSGMAGVASRAVLISIWAVLVVGGGAVVIPGFRNPFRGAVPRLSKSELFLVSICLIALAVNLLVAIAPATKIDELYYHMLVPSRIATDGALHFYRQPWEGAILPQMVFQIAMTPLHALNYPDAANVVSWGLSLMIVWFAWRLIAQNVTRTGWACFWIAVLTAGLYSVVWQVTAGSHAMGDLSAMAAVVAFRQRRRLIEKAGAETFAAMFSILLVAAASTKISLLPLSVVMLGVIAYLLFRSASRKQAAQVALAFALPWIIFAFPLMIWTFVKSGSPFGPVLAGTFAASIYDVQKVRSDFELSRLLNRQPLLAIIKNALISHSPLFWLAALGALVSNRIPKAVRLAGIVFVTLQGLLICLLLPHDLRFLGGLPFGLLVWFALSPPKLIENIRLSAPKFALAASILVLPWLGAQIYYAKQFVPVSIGLQSKSDFYKRYVAFYADYEKLDQVLPKDSVLVTDLRTSAVYSPRPIYFDVLDLPPGKEVFLFGCDSVDQKAGKSWPGYKIGARVYENPGAIMQTYRTPGRASEVGRLCVTRLIKGAGPGD